MSVMQQLFLFLVVLHLSSFYGRASELSQSAGHKSHSETTQKHHAVGISNMIRLLGHDIKTGSSSSAITTKPAHASSSQPKTTSSGNSGSSVRLEEYRRRTKQMNDRKEQARSHYGHDIGKDERLPFQSLPCAAPSSAGDHDQMTYRSRSEKPSSRARKGRATSPMKVPDRLGFWHMLEDGVQNRDYLLLTGHKEMQPGDAERLASIGRRRTERERCFASQVRRRRKGK